MMHAMPSTRGADLLIGSGYRLSAPNDAASVWSLRKGDGSLVGYFLDEGEARAFVAALGPMGGGAGALALGMSPAPLQAQTRHEQTVRLAAAQTRIRWLSEQLAVLFANASAPPANLPDRSEVAEALHKTRCAEIGYSYRPLAQSASYERDYCLRLADAVLALAPASLLPQAA